jgi:hypothetical protein
MIQFKRGSTASWRKNKVKLAAGQPGYDKDKHKLKIGDGESTWAELPYISGLSNEEIGKILGIQAKAVSERYRRLLKKCKDIAITHGIKEDTE